MNKRKYIIPSIIVVMIIIMIIMIFTREKYEEYKTFMSPDNTYSLVVFTEKKMFTIAFSGQRDFKKAYVVLKDQEGKILAKPGMFSDCTFTLGDLYVEWMTEQQKVYYNKFDYIDLSTMKMSCNGF